MEGVLEDSSVVRRKRTARQRPLLSSAATAAVVTSSSASAEFSQITAEEETMANCLVLFARGFRKPRGPEPKATEEATTAMKFKNQQFGEAATTTSGEAGLDVHECKTCNKRFPSFQALGGHRASHKKIKLSIPSASADETKAAVMSEESIQLSLNSFSSEITATARIHECSICGAKFTSGQALGGHMRRHRPVNPQEPAKKEGNSNGLSLDLNLPPPSDDDSDIAKLSSSVSPTKTLPFSFGSKTPVLVLTSSLVNCHY